MSDKFRMVIANIYSLPNGPSLTGRIETGTVQIGDSLEIFGDNSVYSVRVTGIEAFQKSLETATPESGLVAISVSGIDAKIIKNRYLLQS